ncbi:hypothetical protein EGR_07347 [Echinococcus granulosus]|uniref:Uncharacterized protein n=1 Tax=Echinococcus granulosus TaxID=6210 RepID=W6UWC8_ECHGR|nr:hypothetical protein EGR_07347 [Echinococcus granulosus]EUB57779.1 hypothetical protein EGR_07347 [Echinococcus granulosus]
MTSHNLTRFSLKKKIKSKTDSYLYDIILKEIKKIDLDLDVLLDLKPIKLTVTNSTYPNLLFSVKKERARRIGNKKVIGNNGGLLNMNINYQAKEYTNFALTSIRRSVFCLSINVCRNIFRGKCNLHSSQFFRKVCKKVKLLQKRAIRCFSLPLIPHLDAIHLFYLLFDLRGYLCFLDAVILNPSKESFSLVLIIKQERFSVMAGKSICRQSPVLQDKIWFFIGGPFAIIGLPTSHRLLLHWLIRRKQRRGDKNFIFLLYFNKDIIRTPNKCITETHLLQKSS